MLTKKERELLLHQEKRTSIKPQTLSNRLQKIRNKAALAIEDLVFMGDNAPLQLAQALGYNRYGHMWGRQEFKKKTPGVAKGPFNLITSEVLLKRIERHENAYRLAQNLAVNMKIIEGSIQKDVTTVIGSDKPIDMQSLGADFPKLLVGMLKNQFPCPKCGKSGLLFYGCDNWLWMHYNQDDENPKADFCYIGKLLPKRFVEFPLAIEPQLNSFHVALKEMRSGDKISFWT